MGEMNNGLDVAGSEMTSVFEMTRVFEGRLRYWRGGTKGVGKNCGRQGKFRSPF